LDRYTRKNLHYPCDMYLERFEYFCPNCHRKGIVTDILLNPELMIIRGRCLACNLQSSYKAVDMSALQAEYETIPEASGNKHRPSDKKAFTWRFLRFKVRGA
jgi:hypothetical protein